MSKGRRVWMVTTGSTAVGSTPLHSRKVVFQSSYFLAQAFQLRTQARHLHLGHAGLQHPAAPQPSLGLGGTSVNLLTMKARSVAAFSGAASCSAAAFFGTGGTSVNLLTMKARSVAAFSGTDISSQGRLHSLLNLSQSLLWKCR